MSDELLVPITTGSNFPPLIEKAGQSARRCFIEFFTVNIRNRNTRKAYARAAAPLLHWCEAKGIDRCNDDISVSEVERVGI
jgi:hypothetical protein